MGCLQREGDFNETFSPVVGFTTIRIALALAQIDGAEVHHMDITGAFLYGNLNEELYMEQPKGFEAQGQRSMVCKLNKSLYGLKKAPRVWHEHLKEQMAQLQFVPLDYAEIAFKRVERSWESIVVYVYVDDMLLITKSKKLLSEVKKELAQAYKVTDLGPAKYFLGVEIIRNASGVISLSQGGFAGTILDRFKMTDCKAVITPMDPAQYSALTIMLPATD
jgi:Reverse transcriptase (RNA-dependent DNA polymerase)